MGRFNAIRRWELTWGNRAIDNTRHVEGRAMYDPTAGSPGECPRCPFTFAGNLRLPLLAVRPRVCAPSAPECVPTPARRWRQYQRPGGRAYRRGIRTPGALDRRAPSTADVSELAESDASESPIYLFVLCASIRLAFVLADGASIDFPTCLPCGDNQAAVAALVAGPSGARMGDGLGARCGRFAVRGAPICGLSTLTPRPTRPTASLVFAMALVPMAFRLAAAPRRAPRTPSAHGIPSARHHSGRQVRNENIGDVGIFPARNDWSVRINLLQWPLHR